ncbi:MAG TPA: hypothetical protein VHL34_17095, partial [Rhizomicrobium sp.]|nr:hypothetical protein [Rhizomicrobium sp.]
ISWFERAGFRYTETFQIDGYPSPIYRPGGDGIMARTTLMASMQHLSLDISTKPEEHRKETLLTSIPRRLKAGDGVVLMNHPDIHREALAQILAALPTAGVWHATTGDIVAWERASKHDVSATAEGANLQVLYKEPLPQAAVIEIGRGDQSRRLTIPAGTTQVSLKDGKLETATASTAKGRTGVLKDAMGAAMSGLSRLPDRAGKQYAATTEMVRTISQSVGQTKPQFAVISRLGTSSAKDAALSGVKADQAVVLQHAKGAAGESDLLSTLVSANAWVGKTPVLGRSLMEELHPLVAGALAQAISKQSSAAVRDGRSRTLSPVEQQSSAEAALASWILGQAEAATQSSGAIGQGELSYFLASGGNRSLGLTKLLRRLSKQRIGTLVEHGAGIGLIPWLVANEADMEIGRVLLVEPQQRYTTAATALWSPAAEGSTAEMEWADSVSEDYAYTGPVDVVLFCHSMFRMNRAQRQGMLELAWAALRPGGLLIVNEVVREAAEDTAIGPDIVALPDLIAQMTFGEKAPSVFRSDTDWRRAESPSRLSPSEIGSTSFFVAEKPLDAPE